MAVTISELIAKKDEIKAQKSNLYDLETSIGIITVKMPSSKLVNDGWNLNDTLEGNKFLILESVVNPNLKDKELQKAFGCAEPTDIVAALFQAGEIPRIANALLNLAGFDGKVITKKLHSDLKSTD